MGSVSSGTVSFLQAGGFTVLATLQYYFRFNSPDLGCYQQGSAQPKVSASAKTQVPTSLEVVGVSVIPPGAYGACESFEDFGIQLSVSYRVLDQGPSPEPIKSNRMVAQETVFDRYANGQYLGDPIPNWTDIGSVGNPASPSRYTNSSGVFPDAPLGFCASGPISSYSFKQNLSILVAEQYRYAVRGHSFSGVAIAQHHGSLTNHLDINGNR